jgi:hypothetical protein
VRIPSPFGPYVGIGLGDVSDEVTKIKDFIRGKWNRFDDTVGEGPVFTQALEAIIKELQGIYAADGRLKPGEYIPGVVNLATKYALGYLSKEKILPLYFSIEGHMSDMWLGPVAWIGEVLRAEGRALHFPTAYDRTSLPFKNQTGVDELARRVGTKEFRLDNGVVIKFPPGTPWISGGFSQGEMVWVEFYRQFLLPGKPLNWRLKDLKGHISCGSPYRQKGLTVNWITDAPAADRQGIMPADELMTDTPWWWLEIARRGDLYTDNQSEGEIGLYKTAVAKIVTQNKWSGGPAGMLARVIDILSPADDLIPVTMAIIQAVMFVGNMGTHGQYNLDPAVQFLRERLAA